MVVEKPRGPILSDEKLEDVLADAHGYQKFLDFLRRCVFWNFSIKSHAIFIIDAHFVTFCGHLWL